MAADAVLVGQLAVKVRPDTSKFSDELKKDVTKLERTLKVELPVVPDADQLKKDLKTLVKLINARSKAGTSGYQIKLDVDFNTAGIQDRLRELVRELGLTPALDIDTLPAQRALEDLEDEAEETRHSVARPFTIDTRQMLEDLERATDRIDRELNEAGRKRKIELEVQAKLDRDKLDRQLNALGRELSEPFDLRIGTAGAERAMRELGSDYDKLSKRMKQVLEVDWLDPYKAIELGFNEKDQRDFKDFIEKYDGENLELIADLDRKLAQAQLLILTRNRFVDLVVRVKESSIAKAQAVLAALSGYRLLDSTVDNLRRMFENIDKNIPIVGTMALAVQGLSAWLLAAASNTFALAHSLAQMAGAALVLPGILVGIGLGLGGMIAVLKDFNSVLPATGKLFSNLQDDMSSLFWSLAKGPMKTLIDTLFPQFAEGMRGASVALGVFFATLSSSLAKHLSKSMPEMFTNMNDSILIASGSTDAMGRSIEILGRRGSQYLPRFAEWFVDINNQFADWLEKSEQSGKLTYWIEEGIFEIKEFGRAISGASSLLAGFARAAEKAGGSSLTILADQLHRIADIVNGEPFQSNLVNVFEAAHQAMDVIAHKSGPAVSAMMDTLSRTIAGGLREAGSAIAELTIGVSTALNQPAFNAGFSSLFRGLREGIASLAPMWGPLGDALGAIGAAIGMLAENFGPLLATLLTQFAELAVIVGPALEPVVEELTGLLDDVLKAIGPAIVGVIGFLAQFLSAILDSTQGVITFAAAVATILVLAKWKSLLALIQILPTAFGLATLAVKTFFTAIGPIGWIITALAAIGGIGIAIQTATKDAAPAIDQITAALTRANDEVGAFGTRLNTTGPDLKDMAADVDALFTIDAGKGWVSWAYTDTAAEIDGLGEALEQVQRHGFDRWWGEQWAELGAIGDPMNLAAEAIENFDDALAQMVREGNSEAAGRGAEIFAQKAKEQGLSAAETADKLDAYRLALDEQKHAQDVAARAAVQGREAILQYEGALKGAGGVSATLINSINETSKGFIDLAPAVDDAKFSLSAYMDGLEKQVQAQAKWADNMAELTGRLSADVIEELSSMGTKGAPLVQALADSSGEEFARLEEIVKLKMEGARAHAGTAFAGMSDDAVTALEGLPDEVKAYLEEAGIVAYDEAGKVISSIGRGVEDNTEVIKDAGEKATLELIAGMAEPTLLSEQAGIQQMQAFKLGIANDPTALYNAGLDLYAQAKYGMVPPGAVDDLLAHGGVLSTNYVQGVLGGITPARTAGGLLASAAAGGMATQEWVDAAFVNGTFVPAHFAEGINTGIGDAETAGGNLAAGVVAGVEGESGEAVTAATHMGTEMAIAFKEEMGIHSPSTVFAEFGRWIVLGLSGGVDNNAGNATTSISGIATGLTSTFTSVLGLSGAGSSVMRGLGLLIPTGLAGGIGDRVSSVVGAMDTVQGKVDIPNPGAILDHAGRQIVLGFGDAIRQAVHFAADAMVALRGILTISNPGSVLSGAGRSVIDGFVSGLQAGFSRVRSTLNNLTSLLPDWKGPAKTDKTILVNAGQLVIDGFIDGLTSRFGAVRDTLSDLTDEVGATEFAPLSLGAVASTSDLQGRVSAGMAEDGTGRGSGRTLIYNAAPGASLGSEEDLWAASDRARMVGW